MRVRIYVLHKGVEDSKWIDERMCNEENERDFKWLSLKWDLVNKHFCENQRIEELEQKYMNEFKGIIRYI